MKKLFIVLAALTLFLAVPLSASADPIVSGPDLGIIVYGPIDHYAPLGGSDWGTANEAVETWKHPSWPTLLDAKWISSASYVEAPYDANSWRWFHDEFLVQGLPCTAYDVRGTLTVTSDNAEEVYLNGSFVGFDGEVQGSFQDNQEWATLKDYSISLLAGTNTLDFIVRNYSGVNDPQSNPTGLIYKVYDFAYEIPYVEWQPPVINNQFVLKNGTTLPLKFKLYTQQGDLITEEKNVTVKLYEGTCDPTGEAVASWQLGPGVENLRFDPYEYYYIANIKTKELALADGTYSAVVFDGCDGTQQLGTCIQFEVKSDKPANRGNNK